jgi:hypothetical protein
MLSPARIYTDIVGTHPSGDNTEAQFWWQTLGHDSYDEWLAQPPWWQREGYSSYEDADAAWAADEEEEARLDALAEEAEARHEAAEAERARSDMLRRLAAGLRELARRRGVS